MILHFTQKVEDNILWITEEEFRHCTKSLRKNEGDNITVFDEYGNVYEAVIEKLGRNELSANILKTTKTAPKPYSITMVVAPTKSPDRIEWMVAKAVEIGVQNIILVKTDRTERTRHKLDRLKSIAFSSAKQSLNLILPTLLEMESIAEVLSYTKDFDSKYIAHCLDPKEHLLLKKVNHSGKISFLIGPEGDFTDAEITEIMQDGYEEISLGPARLRTETAGIVALTYINGLLQTK